MSPRELESGREGSDSRVFWLTVCDALRANEAGFRVLPSKGASKA